jgi:hypothetical protein
LIDHIIDTRRNSSWAVMPHPSELRSRSQQSLVADAVQNALGLVQDDDLIFEMEL